MVILLVFLFLAVQKSAVIIQTISTVVLAGSVNLDVISAARPNGTNTVRIQSRNYPLDVIELDSLEIREKEFDKAISLIRGVIKNLLI